MFKLAELFVEIKARDEAMQQSVSALKGQLTTLGVTIGTMAGNLAAQAIAGATRAVTGFFAAGVKGATNLGESLSKVGTVFGDSAGAITGTADELAAKFGLSRQSILDAGSGIGLLAQGAGQAQGASAALGAQMARLAADASSFYNVPLDVALQKIKAGLSGESEPLRDFGVLLNEGAVNAEALRLGLAQSANAVDDNAKVMARASLITKGLGTASGDLARTADSTANQWRKFTGTLQNTAVSIGESLMPAITAVAGALGEMATSIASSFEANKGTIKAWADSVAGWIKAVPDAWDTFVAGLAVAFLKVEEWSANTKAVFATLPENLGRIGKWIGENWTKMIADAVNFVGTVFKNFGENLWKLGEAIVAFLQDPTKGFDFNWKSLTEGFKASTEAMPELLKPKLISMQGAIDAVGEELNRKINARHKQAIDAVGGPVKAAAAAAAVGGKVDQFKAESSGIAEFAMKLKEQGLSGIDDMPRRQLDEQKEMNKHLTRAEAALEKMVRQVHGAFMQ